MAQTLVGSRGPKDKFFFYDSEMETYSHPPKIQVTLLQAGQIRDGMASYWVPDKLYKATVRRGLAELGVT